jgi:rhamnosyltransferase subunit B
VEQKDWPEHTLITGFCFYDADAGNKSLPPQLEKFLAAGEAPVVFTLGSAAVLAAGSSTSIRRGRRCGMGMRAVLLIGTDPRNRPQAALPDSICLAEYAPYSALFSKAAMVVHQGGVGTTAQCLRAGKPMLIMPYSHDQPDNARSGCGGMSVTRLAAVLLGEDSAGHHSGDGQFQTKGRGDPGILVHHVFGDVAAGELPE